MDAKTNSYCCDKLKKPSPRRWRALSGSLIFGPWCNRNRSEYFSILPCCFPYLYEPNRLNTKFYILSLAPILNMIMTDIDICERQDKRMREDFSKSRKASRPPQMTCFLSASSFTYVRPWWSRLMTSENLPIDCDGKFLHQKTMCALQKLTTVYFSI